MNPAVEMAPKVSNQSVSDGEFNVEQPFVHMHIPKTAGTSLRRIYEDEFGEENVLLFNPETGRLLPADQRRLTIPNRYVNSYERVRRVVHTLGLSRAITSVVHKKRTQEAETFGDDMAHIGEFDFRVLAGHLDADTVRSKNIDDYPIVTVLREPLARATSFYRHWQRTGGDTFSSYFGHQRPDEVSFEDAVLDEAHHNFQSQWIGNITLTRIGVAEKLGEFLESIDVQQELLRANQDPSICRKPRGDKGFLKEFAEVNSEDYELYYRTLDAWS